MNAPIPWWLQLRRKVIGFVMVLVVFGGIQFFKRYFQQAKPGASTPARAQPLSSKIDPNTADAATLSQLPDIGEKRASLIIAYREMYVRDHPGDVAFKSVDDLAKIRGIGQSTVEQIGPFLNLPSTGPTTQK
jgi:competence ComEA-like helix-hairpin-helix protein